MMMNWVLAARPRNASENRPTGLVDRVAQVALLRLEALEPLAEAVVLLDGERVRGAELVVAAAQRREATGARGVGDRGLGPPAGRDDLEGGLERGRVVRLGRLVRVGRSVRVGGQAGSDRDRHDPGLCLQPAAPELPEPGKLDE